ncbi:MAG TPA: hypothetical protein VMS55_16390 [Myxococcota bacterium]|nr:hypothetical protein [Myxococcota bacterium]
MEQADLMLTSAQIGMALAGFAGLVTLLRRPGPRADAGLNEIRFRSMIELSLALAAFSLLPFVPVKLRLPDAASWRLASAAYSLAALAFFGHSLRRNRRIMGRVLIAGGVTAALLVLCLGMSITLSLDAFGAFPGIESGVYFAALFFHFLATAFFFIRLLYGALPGAEA